MSRNKREIFDFSLSYYRFTSSLKVITLRVDSTEPTIRKLLQTERSSLEGMGGKVFLCFHQAHKMMHTQDRAAKQKNAKLTERPFPQLKI